MALRGTERFVAQNRRARHDYHIEESIEAGMQLAGTEVKVLRQGLASINEAYATEREGDIYLVNAHFPEYPSARFNHEPRHGGNAHVDGGADRDVVDDDRQLGRVVDRLEMLVEPFLGRPVVIGADHESGIGARLLGVAREIDRLLR